MTSLLLINVKVLLRFYARNRLLLAFALLMLVMLALGFVPSLVFDTVTSRFNTLGQLNQAMSGFAFVFVPALGLIAVSSHLRGRNVKMVVTKPCPPEIWLASIFISAALVSIAIHALIATVTAGLSWWWGIPYQFGLVFVALEALFRSLVILSFVVVLTMAVHPVVAVIVALVFNEELFFWLGTLIASSQAARWRALLAPVQMTVDVIYTCLPLYDALGDKSKTVHAALRVGGGEWLLLLLAGGYALVAMTFSFALSSVMLRRKNLA